MRVLDGRRHPLGLLAIAADFQGLRRSSTLMYGSVGHRGTKLGDVLKSILLCVDTLSILSVIFIVTGILHPLLTLCEEVVAHLRSTYAGILTFTTILITNLERNFSKVATASRLLQIHRDICVFLLMLW